MKIAGFGRAQGGERCARCGGAHNARQRCPLDVAPASESAAVTPAEPASAITGETAAAEPPVVASTEPASAVVGEAAPAADEAARVSAVEPSVAAAPPALPAAAAPAVVIPPRPELFAIAQAQRPVAMRARREPRYVVERPDVWPERRRVRRSALGSLVWWSAIVAASTLIIAGLSVASAFTVRLTLVEQRPALAVLAIVLGCAAAAVGGFVLYATARTYAKIVLALVALFLITGGALALTMAPALRQMDTPDLAEYRAFDALIIIGAIAVAAGLLLGAQCVRWALEHDARRFLARWARILGAGYGLQLGVSGLLTLAFVAGAARYATDESTTVEAAIQLTTLAMWSLVPGLILTYQGISSSFGEGSSEFRMPRGMWLVALYGAVLGLGSLAMTRGVPVAWPMPLLHAAGAALPGLALVAFAVRGGPLFGSPVRRLSWRQATLAVAISMTVGVTIALYVESLGSFLSVILLLVHNGAFAGVQDTQGFWDVVTDSNIILSNHEQLVANLITASVLAPVIEEFGKGLGVRFMLRPDTTRHQAFVMGACAGAGFGFLEAMLYGLASVQQDGPGSWGLIMLVRGTSTSLHVFNTSLVGLGWWYAVRGGRPKRAALLFAAAVCMHAAWNGLATALYSKVLGLDALSNHTIEIIGYTSVALLGAAFITAIPLIARRLARADRPPPLTGPITELTPWLG